METAFLDPRLGLNRLKCLEIALRDRGLTQALGKRSDCDYAARVTGRMAQQRNQGIWLKRIVRGLLAHAAGFEFFS